MGERNVDWLPPVCTLTRDRTRNSGMCLPPGIEQATLRLVGQCSNQASYPARVFALFLDLYKYTCQHHSILFQLIWIVFSMNF